MKHGEEKSVIPGQPVILQDGFSSGEITHTHLASVQDHGVTIGQIGMTYFTLPTGKYRETIGWCINNPLDDHWSLLLDAQKECNLLLFYGKIVLIDGFSFSCGRADILLGWYRPKIAYWFNSDFYPFIPSVLLTKIRHFTVACLTITSWWMQAIHNLVGCWTTLIVAGDISSCSIHPGD